MKKFTTAFNRTAESIRDCNVVKFTSPSKVAKSLSYATDLKTIYDNYTRSGKLPLNGQKPIYDENFVKYDSLIEAQKICAEASAYFNGLPADIKNQYGNDMTKFVKALNSCDEFLINKGLLQLPVKEDIKPVDVELPVNPDTPVKEDVNTVTTD